MFGDIFSQLVQR
jgi:hypothetical protein